MYKIGEKAQIMSASTFYLPRVWAGSQITKRALPRPIRPLSAHIKLTENCQAKCISCDYWKTRWQDAINTEQAVDLLDPLVASDRRRAVAPERHV